MASNRQVRNWIVACLRQHLAPDALHVSECVGEDRLLVYTREPGTEAQFGKTFVVIVGDEGEIDLRRENDRLRVEIGEMEAGQERCEEALHEARKSAEFWETSCHEMRGQRDEARDIVLQVYPGAKRLGGFWDDLEAKHHWLKDNRT